MPGFCCSESVGLERVAQYWHSVIQINDYQKNRFVERVISGMFNTVSGKKIAILGFAFKKVSVDIMKEASGSDSYSSCTSL